MFASTDNNSFPVAHDSWWLCLHFARLALDIFTLNDDTRTVAVIEQRLIHCANRDNLPPGLSLATAYALHPDLMALERNSERERDYLQQLAHWAYQFTPGVVVANRNSLLLEIGSCRRLHKGLRNLLNTIRRSLNKRQQYADFGLAHTPKSAWLLAQCGYSPVLQNNAVDEKKLNHQLNAVPIAALEISIDAQDALEKMGFRTLGAICGLPSVALGKRFGTPFIDYVKKVRGESADPQQFFIPAARFQHGIAFIDGIPQRQMLLFPMKRLLQMLGDYLRARQLQCHTLHWQLFDAHRVQAEFSLELSRTQNSWKDLLELSRLKLDQIALSHAVFSINLICENFFEASPVATQLFPDDNDQHEAAASLVDRLKTKLGKNALQYVALHDSYWPEMAWQYHSNTPAPTNHRSTPSNSHRPLWLLPQPKLLTPRHNKPYWQTPLTLVRGPERIGNHWWQEEECERDYYIARNDSGVICWIFYERISQRWFLHGFFA